jgi:hypothetical protein
VRQIVGPPHVEIGCHIGSLWVILNPHAGEGRIYRHEANQLLTSSASFPAKRLTHRHDPSGIGRIIAFQFLYAIAEFLRA